MADEGGKAGENAELKPELFGHDHGQRALEGIEQQRRGGELLVAGPQHVGRADIAGPDGADIAEPCHAREDQAERDRPEQIAEGERREKGRQGDLGDDGIGQPPLLCDR
jgi:hypothetical protein